MKTLSKRGINEENNESVLKNIVEDRYKFCVSSGKEMKINARFVK